jgi:hypothetical protein
MVTGPYGSNLNVDRIDGLSLPPIIADVEQLGNALRMIN